MEAEPETVAPEGWVKWDIPARAYMVMEVANGKYRETFENGVLFQIWYRRLTLSGAVCDYEDVETGKSYLYFPVEPRPAKLFPEKTTDMISCCGIHCRYCFFDGGCSGCMNEPNEYSFGYSCDGRLCTNIRCATEKGIEGCYACSEVLTCEKGFFKTSPYGRVIARFIQTEGKERFEEAVKEMIGCGYNYSKDLEELTDSDRMKFLYAMTDSDSKNKGEDYV